MQNESGGRREGVERFDSALELRGLTKRFGAQTAVDAVDLSVAAGEPVTIVGPSGCGKTTLLRLIAGLESPTAGAIRLAGRDLSGVAPAERDAAMVFQDHALYPHMTALSNIAFPLRMRGTPKDEAFRRARETAALVHADHLLKKRPSKLSGGEQQRVALARAIVRTPAVFLLDEPLAGLDAPLRARFRDLIADLQARLAVTTLYVTHDQAEAMTMGRRVAVMLGGRILQIDTPREVYARPAHRDVAGLIGNPPMALIEGELAAENGVLAFVADGLRLPLPAAVGPVDRRVVLGLRPEHLTVSETGAPARVRRIEEMGHETIAALDAGSCRLHLRLAEPPASDTVRIAVDGNPSFFDPTTGDRIDG